LLKLPNAEFVDDSPYRLPALQCTLSAAGGRGRPYSLVDNVLRLIIENRNVKLNCFFSFNHRDFRDVCARRHIELI
jgi:hypothetical protein